MRKIQSIIFSVFLLMVLFLPIQQGECYVTLQYKDVPLSIGTIKLPQEALIKEIDVKAYSNFFLGRVTGDIEEMSKYIKIYQIAINDGQNNHVAYFATAFDAGVSQREMDDMFNKPMPQEAKDAILKWQKDFNTRINFYIEQTKEKRADNSAIEISTPSQFHDEPLLSFFHWSDVEFITINGKQAYSSDLRLAGEFGGLFVAMYGGGYFFNANGHLGGLFFATIDSDREFWQEIFAKSISKGMTY